jgi:hypothetical protein
MAKDKTTETADTEEKKAIEQKTETTDEGTYTTDTHGVVVFTRA